MEVEAFTKGSIVEVSSDEVGFHGAWYVATLVDIVDDSPSKKSRGSNKKNSVKKGVWYSVKYATLFKDDMSGPLTETVHPSFVRPLPPRNPRREVEAETEEDGDGGVDFQLYDVVDAYLRDGWWIGVVRKVIDDEGGVKKYLISFENPPEEAEFEKSQMLHIDWINSCWKLPPQKTPEQESADKKVTDSNNGVPSDLITPPKKALVTNSKPASLTVSRRLSAKKKKAVTNIETVSAVDGSSVKYHRTTRRAVNLQNENFKSSAGVENSGNKGNTGCMMEQQPNNQDSLLLEQEMIINETFETQDDNSQLKRKRGKLSFEERGIHEISTEVEEEQGLDHLPVLKKSTLNHDASNSNSNSTVVNDSQTSENHHVWPFVKRSPIWATIESQELYKNFPQNPHFSPLMETKEDLREGLAVAHMVTFANLVQRTTNLQWTDVINISLETLVDLEANGFDVGPIRGRLDQLLAKKTEMGLLEGEMKEAEEMVDNCCREKTAIDEEINGLQRKIREAVAMKNVKDEEVMVFRSELQLLSKRIADSKLAFQELVGSPLYP